VLYVQGSEDVAHPRPHLDRFVTAYRKARGVVDLELFDGEGQGFIMRKAGSPASNRAIELSSSSRTSRFVGPGGRGERARSIRGCTRS
jgi:hypothetical protein